MGWSTDVRLGMSGKTVTRADLCEAVYQKVGLSRTESATLVELVLKEITDCLERGDTVKLSSFGSFVVRKKGQRTGRNPRPVKRCRSRRDGSWCSSLPPSSSSGSTPVRAAERGQK
jgi:nucleoid DNA-binding protein